MKSPAYERLTDVAGTVYGVRVRGRLPAGFRDYLRVSDACTAGSTLALEVTFRTIRRLPEVDALWATEPGSRSAGRITLFREPDGFGLTADSDGRGLFRISAGEISVEWLSGTHGAARCFFSYALPLWLESRGVPVLHASAVSFGDRVAAFVGPSGIGKSTLCAGLLRTGCSLVADDGLPLFEDARGDWRCAPGPSWLRLWPSALERHLGIPSAGLPRVQESLEKRLLRVGEDETGELPVRPILAAVYVLGGHQPAADRINTVPCTARDSLIRLIEHSLAGAPVAALGWSGNRLRLLSRVATRTPVKRLLYPAGDGDASWWLVREAIANDLVAGGDRPARDR